MAASDESRLVVRLEASVTQLTKELTKVRQHTESEMGLMVRGFDRGLASIERRRAPKLGIAEAVQRETQAASRSLSTLQRDLNNTAIANTSALSNSLRTTLTAAAGAVSVREIAKYSDADTRIKNSLKVAGLAGDELTQTYDKLFESAQKNGAPLEALSTLYGRLALSQKDLNATAPELIRFTDGVALALKVSGQSATEASGALLQLSQALGGGKIQAEEYNSLIDGARPVLQAVAAGLEEAGGSVAKLTALVKDGKVSSEAFFRAFEAGRPILDEMAANTSATLAQNMQRVENALIAAAGEMSNLAGATETVRQAFDALIAVIGKAPEIFAQDLRDLAKIADVAKSIAQSIQTAAGTIGIIKETPLPRAEGDPEPLAIRVRPKAPNRTIEGGASTAVRPVSLKSFKLPGDKDGKGGNSGADRKDEFEREVEATGKRTRALDMEREALGKSAIEAAKAEASFRLLEAAKRANLPVTSELRAKVDTLSTAYASAKVRLDEAEAAQRSAQQSARFLGDAATDALGDMLIQGESLSDVFDNLAKSIARAALQAALMGTGPLGGVFGGGSSKQAGGLLGTLIGSVGSLAGLGGSPTGGVRLFATGGYTGDGDRSAPAGVVHRGEYVIPKRAVERIGLPTLKALHHGLNGYELGGLVTGATARQESALRLPVPAMPTSSSANLPSVRQGDNYFDLRGSTLTREEAFTAFQKAIAANNRERDRTAGQRMDDWRFNNALR